MSQKQHEQLNENLFKSKYKKKVTENSDADSAGTSALSGVRAGPSGPGTTNAAHLDDTYHNLYIINNNSDLFYTKNEQADRLAPSRLLKPSLSGQNLSNKSSLLFENSSSNLLNANAITQKEKKFEQLPLNEIKAINNGNKQYVCNKLSNKKVDLLKPDAAVSSTKFSNKKSFEGNQDDYGQDEDGDENEDDENNNNNENDNNRNNNDPEETNYLKGCLSQVYLNDEDDPANASGSKRSIPLLLSNLNNQAKKSIKTNLNSIQPKRNIQAKVYNFLERPTGWKCFIYHFTV